MKHEINMDIVNDVQRWTKERRQNDAQVKAMKIALLKRRAIIIAGIILYSAFVIICARHGVFLYE